MPGRFVDGGFGDDEFGVSTVKARFCVSGYAILCCAFEGPAVLLLAYFVLFRKDFSYLLRFLLSVLMIIGVSLLLVPVGDYWYYLNHVVPPQSGVTNPYVYAAYAVSLGGFILFAVFSFWAGTRRLPFNQASLSADTMFLLNVLVMLLFAPARGNEVHPYVWVILRLALFLSAILIEHIRSEYLALVGVLGRFSSTLT